MTIPDRERYSVDRDTFVIHEPYPDHAPQAIRTTPGGVMSYAKGREPIPCEVCFPAPKPVKAKGKPTHVAFRAKPVVGHEGMTWVDDANGARWVPDEDVEDAPITSAIVADMLEQEPA